MTTPAVSVVIPVYNAARHLREALQSLRAQTFEDFEVVCVNDGSTDDSLSILRRFQREVEGKLAFKVISRPNTGIVGALTDGLREARAPLIARFDADDVCLPDRLARQVDYMRAHPDCVLLGAMVRVIDPHGLPLHESERIFDHESLDRELMKGRGGVIRHPVAMIRRDALDRVGGYRRQYQWAEDLDLFLRLAEIGRIANLPEKLLLYRLHPQSVNRTRFEEQARLVTQAVREAASRRGIALPPDWEYRPTPPAPPAMQVREWGWKALKERRADIARKHALSLLGMSIWNREAWRLMACALRGY